MTQGRKEGRATAASTAADGDSPLPLQTALANAGIAVLAQDSALRYLWTRNLPRCWSAEDITGKRDTDFLPEALAGTLLSAKQGILDGSGSRRVELELPSPGGASCYDVWLDSYDDGSGRGGILTTAVEVTEQRRREQTLRTLLREVSHRSKNLLAIIQSIASQTGRHAETINEFLTRFRGRLQSLSSSQDLVTSSNWRGADLAQLINDQVARYCAEPAVNLQRTGENPYLDPNAALHVGLALHELAVNSVSYGALSSPDGRVSVVVRPMRSGAMELEWSEDMRPSGADPQRKRFGTVALERIVPTSLNSTAMLTIGDRRLVYRLVLPADSFTPAEFNQPSTQV